MQISRTFPSYSFFPVPRSKVPGLLLTWIMILQVSPLSAQSISVRQMEGLVHGFLVLRTLEGETLATGDLSQVNHGGKVTSRVIFHFKDGSVHDETVTFSQRNSFRLLNYRLLQKGPVFKTQTNLSIDGFTGTVIARYSTEEGKEKMETMQLKLPLDLANGLIPILIKNFAPNASVVTVSMVVSAPKPRLVNLEISPEGEDFFSVGETTRKGTRYVVKIKIGGVAGVVAPIVGKQPPDTHVWILRGEAPTFLRSEGPLFEGGPAWRIELVSPAWAKEAPK